MVLNKGLFMRDAKKKSKRGNSSFRPSFCYGAFSFLVIPVLALLSGCSISYKFTGASIDYATTKTFSIGEFLNQAPLVYPPASQVFTEELRKLFKRQTRLEEASSDGDFALEGAIVGYDLAPVAVQEDAFSAMTRFTLTVRVDFENCANPKKSFASRTFSASTDFDSGNMFSNVQDALLKQLVEDITLQIFNATAEDW